MSAPDTLNALYAEHAAALNPHGWAHAPDLPAPASLGALILRQTGDDYAAMPHRVAFEPKYQAAFPTIDVPAFFAAHDRIHVCLRQPFTLRGEATVARAQCAWLAGRDPDAAALHHSLMRRMGRLWKRGF